MKNQIPGNDTLEKALEEFFNEHNKWNFTEVINGI